MPRHSPCALYSLTFKRYVWFSYSWIMQAITDSFTQNCNCYPLLLQKCSTIKNSQLSSRFLWKTSLLPCFSSHLIHCSVFKVQFPVPFETRCKRSIAWTLSSILKSLRLVLSGGDSRDRTGDLLLARQALSQLSYIPISYLQFTFRKAWWARVGSNHRPYDYQSYALASWATGP